MKVTEHEEKCVLKLTFFMDPSESALNLLCNSCNFLALIKWLGESKKNGLKLSWAERNHYCKKKSFIIVHFIQFYLELKVFFRMFYTYLLRLKLLDEIKSKKNKNTHKFYIEEKYHISSCLINSDFKKKKKIVTIRWNIIHFLINHFKFYQLWFYFIIFSTVTCFTVCTTA